MPSANASTSLASHEGYVVAWPTHVVDESWDEDEHNLAWPRPADQSGTPSECIRRKYGSGIKPVNRAGLLGGS